MSGRGRAARVHDSRRCGPLLAARGWPRPPQRFSTARCASSLAPAGTVASAYYRTMRCGHRAVRTFTSTPQESCMRFAPPLARGLLLGAALLAPRVAHAQSQPSAGTWALTNARIETVTKGPIEKGTIVIRDGLIEAVGADVTPPGHARGADATGRPGYPGSIALPSSMGLPTPPPQQQGFGGGGGGQNAGTAARNVGLEPGRMIATEVAPPAA